jgi:restriction system protein
MSFTKALRFLADLVAHPPSIKGWVGELQVNAYSWLLLDKKIYHRLSGITIELEDGTTQIDYIIVSRYGIFVIETKNISGWIFGSANQATWTQKLYKKSFKFQNPLRQNYRHTKALQTLLNIPEEKIISVVVFVGDTTLKTDMPPNVTKDAGVIRYIKSFKEEILSEEEIQTILETIQNNRLKPGLVTHVNHIRSLNERHSKAKSPGKAAPVVTEPVTQEPVLSEVKAPTVAPSSAVITEAPPMVETKPTPVNGLAPENDSSSIPTCPRCGAPMVERVTKRGNNVGKTFYGCSQFPKCRGMINP